MPNINRVFTGGLNLDDHPYRLPENAYLDSLNITRDSQGEGQDGVVANILGNVSVSNSLPSGTNKIIGGLADKLRNRYYFFNWNSNGNNGIYYYSQDTGVVTKILLSKTDSGGIDILNFNPSYKIYGVNLIYRDDIEGDLLYFNDGLNEPRVINTVRTYATWLEEYISVAKAPPQMSPKVTYENDNEVTTIVTPVLTGDKSIDQDLFTGGIQTDFVSLDSITSDVFTLGVGGQSLTYTGAAATADFDITFPFSYNFPSGTATVVLTKNGTPIAASSQTVSAGFSGFLYSKQFSEALATNDVLRLRVTITTPISYPTQFFTCNSGSFEISTSITNQKVSVNNLRNSLFQFKYRFVFADFEKSVWSSASIVPLPNQDSLLLTEDDITKNCRISVSMSTGGIDVAKIELAARQTKDGVTSDYFLIDSFDKDELSIADNDIYTFNFYNDGLYSTIDIIESLLLQDYVPQKAKAQEILNGNTPIYGAITEGYDKVSTSLEMSTLQETDGYFLDYCGLLFFAQVSGLDSGVSGTQLKIHLYGTGTNAGGNVSILDNAAATYIINAVDGTGTNIGISYLNTNIAPTVAALLASISTALQANGWSEVSLDGNILTMSFAGGFTLYSSGVKYYDRVGQPYNTLFASAFDSGYEYAIQYFDKRGRTNGALTNIAATFNTDQNDGVRFPQPRLSISHRPPTWARYYQVLRSNNSTYGNRLNWVTVSAYSNTNNATDDNQFAYLGIGNIEFYNREISSRKGVVSYTFQAGDRVRLLSRYNENAANVAINIVDYEVVGTEVNPIIDGITRFGTFVKIKYPTNDIDSSMRFDGTAAYQNYEILLYNYIKNTSTQEKPFFEFGKCFAIGNAGTNTAYHIGLNQTQSTDLVVPALIDVVNGDLFSRKRKVPIGTQYYLQAGLFEANVPYISVPITVPASPVTVGTSYRLATQIKQAAGIGVSDYPTNSATDNLYQNNSAVAVTVNFKASFSLTADLACKVQVVAKLTNGSGVSVQPISTVFSMPSINTNYDFTFDGKVLVQPSNKLFVLLNLVGSTVAAPFLKIGYFTLEFEVEKTAEIQIEESSFSDVFALVTNSNGRVSVVDENAKQTYFPTLVRFGQSYQADTSVNGTNRFYPENFDTYDRGFGDIQRFHVRDRYLKVYQKLKVGNVPVLTQIVKDVAGNPLQANTDQLINKIQYYSGDYGIGDSPCSLAWDNFADYFVDDFRGVVCRLSQDGISPISIMYKTNSFFASKLKAYRDSLNNGIAASGQVYKGNPTVYGTFDAFTNKYIVALEEINRYSDPSTLSFRQDPYTLSFDEVQNQWESFYSYHPEWLGTLNTLLLSFKNGGLWRHNNTVYCNFYGTQYDASIEAVFNNGGNLKKTWISLAEFANTVWDCPEISSQLNTYGTTPQSSRIPASNFKTLESNYHSNFLRDINSSGGLANGSALKGNYLIIKFRKQNASQFYYINLVSVNFIDSPLNKS
ncbi:MAG: hypothetical protein B7Y37_13865 [Sphingobacteriia bacterium 28-36-52]|nr:MAG: hypothetical protein B7Y37_13865 [Sphingobacteriia bacterium 28-36-52]